MNKPFGYELRPTRGIAACVLLFACSNTLEGTLPGDSGRAPEAGNAGTSTAGTGASSGGTSAQGGGSATGGSGVTGGTGQVVPDPPPFRPAAAMLRRLTRAQFHNALRDVFDTDVDVSELDADNWNLGDFATIGAATVVTSERGVEAYHAAVEGAVNAVFDSADRRAAFMGCTPGTMANDACVRGYVESMGRRAWRRPLEADEVTRVMSVATNAAMELGSGVEGARWATLALFSSPNFLYRPELGVRGADGSLRFSGYEMASRLAFLIWNSVPDTALLDDAESGALGTATGVRAAAERLLAQPAGRESVGAFAEEYMRLDRIATQAKDGALFPEYGPALQAAMARDMRDTWAAVAFDDRASVFELFTTPKVVVNAELAELYGVDATGLDSNTFRTVSLPADGPRSGILAKAGFLSQFANQKEGSPTLRGKFLRSALMCETIPPPPPNVNTVLEDPPADMPMTKRQRLERHRTDPNCAGCHAMMDPLGLPFENFDAVGRYRTLDHGLPIDPSSDFDGAAVADARALGAVAASSSNVAQCLLRRYYAYALGYPERDVDGSVLNTLGVSFQDSGFKLRDLVLALVTHDVFSAVAPQP